MAYGILDLVQASQTELHVFLRQDPVILKAKNPKYDGMKNYIEIWFAGAVAGFVAGSIQSIGSLWFLVNACMEQEVRKLLLLNKNKTKWEFLNFEY
jgi:hypothetical protein